MKPLIFLAGLFMSLSTSTAIAAGPCDGPWVKPELFTALPEDKQAAELGRLAEALQQGCTEAFNGLGYLAIAVPDDYEGALRWFSLLIKVGETQARQIGVQSALIEQFLKKIGELSTELTEAAQKVTASETQAKALLVELQRKDAELAAVREKLESTSSVTERQHKEIATLSEERGRLTGDISKVREELRKAVEEADQGRQKYDKVSSVLNLKISELNALKSQHGEVSVRLTEALARIGSLDSQATSQKKTIAELTEKNTTLQGFVSDKAIENEDLRKQVAGLDGTIEQMNKTVEQMSLELKAKIEELRKAQVTIGELEATIRGSALSISDLEEGIRVLETKLDDTNATIFKLTDDIDVANGRISELVADLQTSKTDLDAERKEHEKTKLQLSDAKKKAGELEAKLGVANDINSKLEAQLGEANDINSKLEAQLGLANVKNSDLQTGLEAERKAHDATKKEVERISKLVSKFYALLVKELGGKEGIQVVGDRFIIQSEVLFDSGAFELSAEGRTKIGKIAAVMKEIAPSIPADLKWGLQINGYTDIKKIKPGSVVKDNWELSTRRALTVLRLLEENGIASDRLAAAGYGENHPIATGSAPEDLKKNRRIELKLTD